MTRLHPRILTVALLLLCPHFATAPSVARASTLYGIGTLGTVPQRPPQYNLFDTDPGTAALTQVSPITAAPDQSPLFGGLMGNSLVDSPTGTLYTTDAQKLYRLDPSTGIATSLGSLPFAGIVTLAFSPSGTLYGEDSISRMYSINPQTAASVLLGTVNEVYQGNLIGPILLNDLVYAPSGVCYATDGEALYSLDVANLTANWIGLFPSSAPNGIKQLSIGSDGTIYGSDVSSLYTIAPSNLTTINDVDYVGVTFIGSFSETVGGTPIVGHVLSMTFAPVPEPGCFALMIVGSACLAIWTSSRKRRG